MRTPIQSGALRRGALNESCTTICGNQGEVYDPATQTYAGSLGTDSHCNRVLDAVGAGPGNYPYVNTTCGIASECMFAIAGPDSQRARCNDYPANPSASNGFHRRACACTAP